MRPTASRARVWLRCSAALAYPEPPDRETAPAVRGTMVHAWLEAVGRGASPEEAAATLPPSVARMALALDLAALPVQPGAWAQEVAMMATVDGDAVELARGQGRAYPERTGAVYGTADVLGVSGRTAHVVDWKTGLVWQHARDSEQLLVLAVLATRVYDLADAEVSLVFLREDGEAWSTRHRYDMIDLAEAWMRIRRQLAAEPRETPGPWCEHCPVTIHCATWGQSLRTAIAQIDSPPPTLQAAAVAAVRLAKLASKAAHWLRWQAEQVARESGPLDLGDGVLWGVRASERTTLDGRTTAAVLEEMLGPEAVAVGVEMAASKAGVERAVKATLLPGEKVAPRVRRIIEEIEARGGVARTPQETVGEFRRKD